MIAGPAHAGHAPPTVAIALYAYAPDSITVVENDVVHWDWKGPDVNHSVTSDSGLFDSGVLDKEGASFEYFFDKAGEYAYHCTVHANMKGRVVVQAGPQYDTEAPVLSHVRLRSAGRRRAVVGFTVSEDVSVALRVRRRGAERVLRRSFTFVSAGDASARVRMAGLRAGHYTVSVRAQDAAGNRSAVKTVRVTR